MICLRFDFFRSPLLFLVSALLAFPYLAQGRGTDAILEKVDAKTWTISYQTSEPVERIAFQRNPDNSRAERWTPSNDGLQIIVEESKEYIVRKDGEKFYQAAFRLKLTHQRFENDYAPFSPFSDGGMLVHSGRFFACELECTENRWHFTLKFPDDEHAIFNGELKDSEFSWIGSNSGEKIYIGTQKPVLSNGFISLIDQNLPAEIKATLDSHLPNLTEYFQAKLGKISSATNPSLFVSFSPTTGPSVRAGVLPQQIFIHLDNDDLEELAVDQDFLTDLVWTIAHEVAHYFQRLDKQIIIDDSAAWLHEGHAEMLAFDALQRLYPSSTEYLIEKVNMAEVNCANDLKDTPLINAAEQRKFRAFYSCGFLIFYALSKPGQSKFKSNSDGIAQSEIGDNIYELWKQIKANTADSSVTNKVFIDTVEQVYGDEISARINQFMLGDYPDVSTGIDELIDQPL